MPFKVYADFECILKGVQSSDKNNNNNSSYTEKYQDHIFSVLFMKLIVLLINSVKELCFIEKKNAIHKFIEAILKGYDYCKKIVKKHFNKNLVMSAEDEERF